ncbi:MAG: hypothetical protein ACI9R3_006598 [Verrucomicrobiales bacterium]|jgi:hypothetical protein
MPGGGTDYDSSALQITISVGNTSGTTTVTTNDDYIIENTENFQVEVAAVTNATDGSTPQTVQIKDNDVVATLEVTVVSSEDGGGTITPIDGAQVSDFSDSSAWVPTSMMNKGRCSLQDRGHSYRCAWSGSQSARRRPPPSEVAFRKRRCPIVRADETCKANL